MIWLPNDEGLIGRNIVKVDDKSVFERLKEKYKGDTDNFIFLSATKTIDNDPVGYSVLLGDYLYQYRQDFTYVYRHPINILCDDINKKMNIEKNTYKLLWLINNSQILDRERTLRELKTIRETLDKLDSSSLDSDTIKNIIKHCWPLFGFFSTEIFDSISFEPIDGEKMYSQSEIATFSSLAQDRFLGHTDRMFFDRKVDDLQSALDNQQVLSLVKKYRKSITDRS